MGPVPLGGGQPWCYRSRSSEASFRAGGLACVARAPPEASRRFRLSLRLAGLGHATGLASSFGSQLRPLTPLSIYKRVCVCVCVRACARVRTCACVRMCARSPASSLCVCVCVGGRGGATLCIVGCALHAARARARCTHICARLRARCARAVCCLVQAAAHGSQRGSVHTPVLALVAQGA